MAKVAISLLMFQQEAKTTKEFYVISFYLVWEINFSKKRDKLKENLKVISAIYY